MTKWEYKVLGRAFGDITSTTLDTQGQDGWELVSVTPRDDHYADLIFKRPAVDPEPLYKLVGKVKLPNGEEITYPLS